MSRNNKVNKTNYVQRGRLTPDEMARELASAKTAPKQAVHGRGKERIRVKGDERGASRPRSGREE
jgi:hypothetical protein